MEQFIRAYQYFLEDQDRFWNDAAEHIGISGAALIIAIVVCVPLGIWLARHVRIAEYVINAVGALRIIPSIAILFLVLPYLRTGFRPALVGLVVLALPPVLINTYAGIRSVDQATVEAAHGMGMSARQVLRRVELPLALPAIIAGIRTASVEVIASATLASFIGAGGLGDYILRGTALNRSYITIVGAVAIALLALCSEGLFGTIQRFVTTKK